MTAITPAALKLHFVTVTTQNLSLPLGREVAVTVAETKKNAFHLVTSQPFCHGLDDTLKEEKSAL